MKAVFTPTYGSPDVLEIREVPAPAVGPNDVRVAVHATAVTEGDRRLRSADFPGFTAPFGRLLIGLTGPRKAIQGSTFAGRVVEVGAGVTRFEVGDDVFGGVAAGAYADELVVAEDSAVARMPSGIGYDEAAAVPYGAGTALHFLQGMAGVQAGERVLVLGASGGVGRFAVQIARHLGAHVTAVCSAGSADLVRELGAHEVIDYHTTDFRDTDARYDVVLDIADATSFGGCRRVLTPTGRYLTLYMSLSVLFQMARTRLMGGPRAYTGVSIADRTSMEALAGLMADAVVVPVVAARFPLERIRDAHAAAEARRDGAVVVVREQAPGLRAVG